MTINPTSLAVGNAVGITNAQFVPGSQTLVRKGLNIGTYDPLKTSVVDDVPIAVTSAADAGDRFGFGSMLHLLVKQFFIGSDGVECQVVPQSETGVAATGTATFVPTAVVAETVPMYISGVAVPFNILAAATAEDVGDACVAAVTAKPDLPVTAANVLGVVTFTSKSMGPWGNDISIKFAIKSGEAVQAALDITVVDMASGTGIPDISTALDGLGTGDNANENGFTDVVHGYGNDTTTLDAILTYVGAGNDFVGTYKKTVARPFRVLVGDVATGSAGLIAIRAIGDGRKTDRANGTISVPGSASHPSEIAAQAMGHMARININSAHESYAGIILIEIDPGETADRWTSEYDNRDLAVKSGVSTSLVEDGVVKIQNMVTYYHPDSVPAANNLYRAMRNISIIQNTLAALKANFAQEQWLGISIVADVSKVESTVDREKVRDVNAVIDDLVAMAYLFESRGWIFEAAFTIERLKLPGAVTIRDLSNGFDSTLGVILSGEGGIYNTTIEADISFAALAS